MPKKRKQVHISHAIFALSMQIILGICAVIASLFVFLKLAYKIIDNETVFFDSSIINFMYSLRSPEMTALMKGITFLGGEIFLGTATAITILILFKKHKNDALNFIFILLFGIGLNLFLKDLFQRPRPDFMPLIHEATYSFPSGHAMNSFVFYMTLSYFIFHETRRKMLSILFASVSAIIVLLIGISRIYLGVHYPSDVIAGYAAGILWFCLVILFEKTVILLRSAGIKN
jgi:membrane-associated phospholipid phosphatase